MGGQSPPRPGPPGAPVAPRFPPAGGAAGRPPGDADPYAWMRGRDLPAMRGYLAAERAYYDRWLESVRGLRDELAGELAARVIPADESVSWRLGGRSYFTRTVPGREFGQFCRAGDGGTPAQVLLDENLLLEDPACGGGFVALGVREVSPDGRLLAYSVDFDGDELYQLRIRDLASGADLAERIDGTYYGLAWSADSRSLLYVVTDAQYRPHEVWRHRLGTEPERDVLVFREEDERFDLTVRATRSGACVLIETSSRDTTETLVLPAHDTGRAPAVLQGREPGTEYRADHAAGPGGGSSSWSRTPGRRSSGWSGPRRPRRAVLPGPRSSRGRRTPAWSPATCSGGTWWWSSGAARRPSCASWSASQGTSG